MAYQNNQYGGGQPQPQHGYPSNGPYDNYNQQQPQYGQQQPPQRFQQPHYQAQPAGSATAAPQPAYSSQNAYQGYGQAPPPQQQYSALGAPAPQASKQPPQRQPQPVYANHHQPQAPTANFTAAAVAAVRPVRQGAASSAGKAKFDPVAHLKSQGFTDDDISDARQEHADRTLPLGCATQVLADSHGGHGMRMYFEFFKFYAGFHFVMTVLQIVLFILSAEDAPEGGGRFSSGDGSPFYYGFFISSFGAETHDAWMTLNVICLIIAFVVGPCYVLYVGQRWGDQEKSKSKDADVLAGALGEAPRTDRIVRLTREGYIDVGSHYRTGIDLIARRTVSLVVFLGFLVLQVLISIALTEQDDGSFFISLVVAVIAVIIDFAYNFAATMLTEFEKHDFNSSALRWLTVKLMFFKVANIMAVYGARSYSTNDGRCVYSVIGSQVLSLWLVEIIAVLPGTVVGTMVWSNNFQAYAKMTGNICSDESAKPPFQLAREYLKVIYYGFLSYAGMVVFPLSLLLGFVAIGMQYWSAKFRITKICGNPLTVDHSQRFVVLIGLLLAAFAGLVTPNAGASFVLSGDVRESANTTCALPK
jgi:hypothetical protein